MNITLGATYFTSAYGLDKNGNIITTWDGTIEPKSEGGSYYNIIKKELLKDMQKFDKNVTSIHIIAFNIIKYPTKEELEEIMKQS